MPHLRESWILGLWACICSNSGLSADIPKPRVYIADLIFCGTKIFDLHAFSCPDDSLYFSGPVFTLWVTDWILQNCLKRNIKYILNMNRKKTLRSHMTPPPAEEAIQVSFFTHLVAQGYQWLHLFSKQLFSVSFAPKLNHKGIRYTTFQLDLTLPLSCVQLEVNIILFTIFVMSVLSTRQNARSSGRVAFSHSFSTRSSSKSDWEDLY